MKVNILLFGQLTDIVGSHNLMLENITDTGQLVKSLNHRYPALIHSKYLIAVDKNIISQNTALSDNCTVALLPPFSGG